MGISIRHNIDAPMVFVYRFDESWDMARINAELAACGSDGSPWASQDEHPWQRYVDNKSRCDIGTVSEYLRSDKQPTEFWLRQIDLSDWNAIEGTLSRSLTRELFPQALSMAIAHGLDTVKGEGSDVLAKLGRKKQEQPIGDKHLNDLRLMLGQHVWRALGFAVIACNSALTEEEKRPFDSSRGD